MPPTRRAGKSAFVEKYKKPDGELGMVVHCRLCGMDGRSWSSRAAARKLLGGGRRARPFDSLTDVMDLFAVHMKQHHPSHEQPDWQLSDDVDEEVIVAEAKFFELSAEEVMLRKIFGERAR